MSSVRVAACRSRTGQRGQWSWRRVRARGPVREGHSARAAERARTEKDEVRV